MPDYTKLSARDRALIWRFRYSLKENSSALPKFLLSTDWTKEKEVQEALRMMKEWTAISVE